MAMTEMKVATNEDGILSVSQDENKSRYIDAQANNSLNLHKRTISTLSRHSGISRNNSYMLSHVQTTKPELQRVIFLDEPTTGLDPITKRAVWRTIEQAKRQKIILLTTHSMEEADSLAQYIGIMAAGQMRCLGTRQHLKQRFGSGYRLQIICKISSVDDIEEKLYMKCPSIRFDKQEPTPFDNESIRLFFVIPADAMISYLYKECQQLRESQQIQEFGLEFTSLEEVFITISQLVEPPDDVEAQILNL